MNYLKPFLIAAAGFVVALLVAFKNQTTTIEYATLKFNEGVKTNAIALFTATDIRYFNSKFYYHDGSFVEVLNTLSKEGWRVISSDYTTGQTMNRVVYLERTKQE